MTTLDEPLARPIDRGRLLAIGAVAVTMTLWASAFVGIRSASPHLSPGGLAFGRLTLASFALGGLMLARGEHLPPKAALPAIAAFGVFWLGLYNMTLNEAELHVDAGTASLLVNTGSLLVAVLAGLFLREGFPRQLLFGCLIAFGGAAVIALATSQHGVHASWGAAMCLFAALFYAVGLVCQKTVLSDVSPLQVTFTACLVGALVSSPFAPTLIRSVAHAPGTSLGWMLYLGLGPTALGFTTWTYALARTSAGRMGVSTYLVPPISILLGWLLLAETPPALAYAGGALCLAGVAVSRRR